MTQIQVGVIGYDPIGKRVVDAISQQPDFSLAGVWETDPHRIRVIRTRGIPLVEDDLTDWSEACHVVVVCQADTPELSVPTVYSPEIHRDYGLFPASPLPVGTKRLRVACADALAFSRLLTDLPAVKRLFSHCARRSGRITDRSDICIDALEPMFDLPGEDSDVRELLASRVQDACVRRTRMAYTHSHLHHLKLDLEFATSSDIVLDALMHSPRVRVAPGATSFPDTGRLQEFDRDLGSPRGDRFEVFVWEESVEVVGRTVFLTADVSPDATPVLEIIDAVRTLARPEMPMPDVARLTDHSLMGRG
jgi:glyceraldehyde-3-phosphate dehydrogenase (NAD(P))